jgi:hypothetical protein
MRLLRERRAAGFMMITIKIPESLIDDLVDANLISAFDVDDKAKIAAVLERLIRVSSSPEKTE